MVRLCSLVGHNSVRLGLGMDLLELSRELSVGDIIAYVQELMQTKEGMNHKISFSGSVFFERMKERKLYTSNTDEIKARVEELKLTNLFSETLMK